MYSAQVSMALRKDLDAAKPWHRCLARSISAPMVGAFHSVLKIEPMPIISGL
jgi:hypothetical protein